MTYSFGSYTNRKLIKITLNIIKGSFFSIYSKNLGTRSKFQQNIKFECFLLRTYNIDSYINEKLINNTLNIILCYFSILLML